MWLNDIQPSFGGNRFSVHKGNSYLLAFWCLPVCFFVCFLPAFFFLSKLLSFLLVSCLMFLLSSIYQYILFIFFFPTCFPSFHAHLLSFLLNFLHSLINPESHLDSTLPESWFWLTVNAMKGTERLFVALMSTMHGVLSSIVTCIDLLSWTCGC